MTTVNKQEKRWTQLIRSKLEGRTIAQVRYLTDEETEASGWHQRPIMIVLDNGMQLIPMQDDEGNDGGSMATSDDDLKTIPVLS